MLSIEARQTIQATAISDLDEGKDPFAEAFERVLVNASLSRTRKPEGVAAELANTMREVTAAMDRWLYENADGESNAIVYDSDMSDEDWDTFFRESFEFREGC